jgi:uroporphyrinogen-III synthase
LNGLEDRSVVVTRPAKQAAALIKLIEQAGGRAYPFPVIEIEPIRSPGLDATVNRLASFNLAIFISRNAVEHGLASSGGAARWPAGVEVAAIGQGSRAALLAEGFADVHAPKGPSDSEALLDLPRLKHVSGERIVIFRGVGGRAQLAEMLRARGAEVEYAECYRRIPPRADAAPLIERWKAGGIHAVTVSSGEGLQNLFDVLGSAGQTLLRTTLAIVPHQRVAENARALGMTKVEVAGAADEEVLAALVAYFGRAS